MLSKSQNGTTEPLPPNPGLELLMEKLKNPGLTSIECPHNWNYSRRYLQTSGLTSPECPTHIPELELELLMEDLETSKSNQTRMPPNPELEFLMVDFVWWIGVWRLPLYPQAYRFVISMSH